jgi:hypothetical protein
LRRATASGTWKLDEIKSEKNYNLKTHSGRTGKAGNFNH